MPERHPLQCYRGTVPGGCERSQCLPAAFERCFGALVRLLLGQADGECVGLPLGLFPLVAAQVV
ncbi:hypothetical protein RB199_18790 [Streptomyces libani]